jgi:hypothetical protein
MKPCPPLAFLPALLLSAALHAQMFAGTVKDRSGEGAVKQATVEALAANDRVVARARSGDDGAFVLRLRDAGEFRLRVQRLGYRTATSSAVAVASLQTVHVELRISTAELALDPLTVTGHTETPRDPRLDREGFYGRQQMHVGSFVTREQLDRRRPLHSTEALRGIPGVRLQALGGTTHSVALMTRKDGGCVPLLLVDNIVMPGDELDLQIVPQDIAGIEVYRGTSEIPGRYISLASTCGLIVVWSRDGEAEEEKTSAAADSAGAGSR